MTKRVWALLALIITTLLTGLLIVIMFRHHSSSKSVQIGAILPLSGDVASYGVSVRDGIDLALDEVNRNRGIAGRPVSVLYKDDKGQPDFGVSAVQELISLAHVDVIIGSVPSSVTLAIAPIANRSHVILFSPASSSPKLTGAGDYIFRNYPSDEVEGRLVAQFAIQHGYSTAAVLTINNDYGNGLNPIFVKTFTAQGGSVLLNDRFSQGSGDFRTILVKIKQFSPKCIFIVGYGRELGTIVRQARQLGVTSQFLSTVNFQDAETLVAAGAAADGTIYSSAIFDPNSADPHVAEFVASFHVKYGHDPDVWSAHGYDALMMIIDSMRKCGTDADDVRQCLHQMKDFPGVAGKTTIDKNGDPIKDARFMTVRNGSFVPYSDPPQQ